MEKLKGDIIMIYQIVDLLDKAIAKDTEKDITLLIKEGLLTSEGQIVQNKINLMTGAYASDLLDCIMEADMNVQEVIEYIEESLKDKLISYIQQNLAEQLSLESIADHFMISPAYLSAYFKKETGLNISYCISKLRVERAMDLLRSDSTFKIQDVGAKVGIYSQATFIRLFRKHTGITPIEYRRAG
jgi:YesN/AraC family two-component response regulator